MINEDHQEQALLVKEMLSSESGYYTESMAPLIGYPKAFHGTLFPTGLQVIPCKLQSTNGLGKVLMDTLDIYKEVSALINEDGDTMKIYANENLLPEEMYRVLESWCHSFYEKRMNEL